MPTSVSRPRWARVSTAAAVLTLATTLVGHAADPPAAGTPPNGAPLMPPTPVATATPPAAPLAQAPSRNAKQALLAGEWRPGEDTGVLRARATQGRPVPGEPSSFYVPGHVVVKFAPDMTESAMGALAHDVGATRIVRPHHADFSYVEIPADADPVAAASEIAARPGVVYAEPDAKAFPLYTPNDPLWRYQWNLQKLDLPKAWDINQGGRSSVVVAVIDTGVAYLDEGNTSKAPDLAGTSFRPGFDFVWDDDRPVDLEGHGTHVTGTIAETTNNSLGVAGFAFNVSIMPIKAIYTDWDAALDAPYPYGSSTVARAIRFAADNGAQVINLSLGSFGPSQTTRDALVYAVGKGAFVAVAAGNSGDTDNAPLYPAVYARDIEGVMAVAAVDEALERAPYSNMNDYVEISAPGGNVDDDLNEDGYGDGVLQQTLDPDAVQSGVFNRFTYLFADGTSMASPHVAALAALLIDQGINKPAAVEDAIKHFATDLGPPGRDDASGYGLINPRATLRGLGLGK